MKVRIGIGGTVASAAALQPVVDGIGEFGFDSIWCSEVLTAPNLDPTVALSWAAARDPKLKLGTTMLLPGRNIMRLAKQLSSLDSLSAGRLLVTFVPGIHRSPETEAIGMPVQRRRAAIDEALPLLRRLLAGETVSHDGAVASLAGVTLDPLPVQQPLEFWLGGMARRSLELCGRAGDGWLPSLCTPAQAAAGREIVDAAAASAGRAISPEHFGVSIGYSREPISDRARQRLASRSAATAAADIDQLAPIGLPAVRRLLEDFVAVGFSKFVLRPLTPPDDWHTELGTLAAAVGDLQT